jgi:pantothenate kinase-related protein Tda10
LELGEKKRLELRRKRGVEDKDEMGDVTYINQKVCGYSILWSGLWVMIANYARRISSSTTNWRDSTTNIRARSATRSREARRFEFKDGYEIWHYTPAQGKVWKAL